MRRSGCRDIWQNLRAATMERDDARDRFELLIRQIGEDEGMVIEGR